MIALLSVALAAAPVIDVSHRKVVAPDSTALAVYRYQLRGGSSALPPIVLVPDLGFSRAAWDFEGRGLARTLASGGRTVFVVELRGQGKAGPGLSIESLAGDLGVVLDALAVKQIDLVVHGWAGSAVIAASARDSRLRRVVALNTPVLAEVPSALAERFLVEGGRFSTLGGSPQGARAFEHLFALWSAFPPGSDRAFLSTGTRDLSRPVAAQLLAWMRAGDLPMGDSTVGSRLRSFSRPTLLLVGLADGFASPELCSPWRELDPNVSIRVFSRVETREDFSHLSMLLGENAPRVVFPLISKFLEVE